MIFVAAIVAFLLYQLETRFSQSKADCMTVRRQYDDVRSRHLNLQNRYYRLQDLCAEPANKKENLVKRMTSRKKCQANPSLPLKIKINVTQKT